MNRSPAATSRPLPSLPSSVRPYCKHFVLPIGVYTGTLFLMTVKSPLLRIACTPCLGRVARTQLRDIREHFDGSCRNDSLGEATCVSSLVSSPSRQANSTTSSEPRSFFFTRRLINPTSLEQNENGRIRQSIEHVTCHSVDSHPIRWKF